MDVSNVIALIVSGLALVVAVYGIFDRRAASNQAARLRLIELVDELNQVDIDEQRDLNMDDDARNLAAKRRALLVAQAEELMTR